jgi:peroxiredoxin
MRKNEWRMRAEVHTPMKILAVLAAGVLAASLIAFGVQDNAARTAAVGQPAPDFKLVDSNGKEHSLSDFKGKYVVLEWFNHQCPFVVKHYRPGHMQSLQKQAKEMGVVWLTIISSAPGKQGHRTPAQANELISEWNIASAAMLLDESGRVGRLYGARTTPHMFVISPEGQLIYAGAITDNPSADSATIQGARNHVMEALREAMAGKPVSVPTTQPYGCTVKY